ncbi:hypothetical protein LXA43DRAFT_704461 [Ganoderma leucocontextum]|nr:hypothetical protein LXA43DRAFT_704461 [Ganoderma leucocontextum]
MDFTGSATHLNQRGQVPRYGDWELPDPKAIKAELAQEFTKEETAKVWNDAAKAVKTYHDELVEQWQKAMDTLLVYAGLFSAVLTAFNVQSYPLLQPAPTDASLAILQQISAQLNSFSVNPSFINSTQPVRSLDQLQVPFRAPLSAVWINALWFASLVFSLASASIALIVKQWLHEVSSGLSGTSRETARLRQHRLNSLIKWKIGTIVLVPSVLLQIALVLFLSGLLVLLWTIHQTVASVTTILVGALFLFFAVVTALPVFKWDCCYRSPQARGAFFLVRSVWNGTILFMLRIVAKLCLAITDGRMYERSLLLRRIANALFTFCVSTTKALPRMPTWHGAEQTEVARDTGLLDRRIAMTAYTITFATRHLETLPIVLSDLPCEQVAWCFHDVYQAWCRLWGLMDVEVPSRKLKETLFSRSLLYGLRKMLSIDFETRQRIGDDWLWVPGRFLWGAEDILPRSDECLSTLVLLSIGDSALSKRAFTLLDRCFLDENSPAIDFPITSGTLRNVFAMCKWHTERWDVHNKEFPPQQLSASRLLLVGIRQILIDNAGLSLEEEARILNETRDYLPFLRDKLSAIDWEHWRPKNPWDFAWWLRDDVLGPLVVLCWDVPRACEVVPDDLLTAIQQCLTFLDLLCTGDSDSESEADAVDHNVMMEALRSAIRQWKHRKAQAVPCFSSQQPPITFF